jgi:hypothetical protein
MPSPALLFTANALTHPGEALEHFFALSDVSEVIRNTHVDWELGRLLEAPQEIESLLTKVNGLAVDGRTLTEVGLRLLGKLQVELESEAKASALSKKFEIFGPIAKGSNSVALKATNKVVGRTVVLKILQPVQPQLAEEAIKNLGKLENVPHLVAPIDSHVIETTSSSGDPVRLYCIVFPYVAAVTLDQYLASRPPVTPFFFEAFVRQVGGVLETLEAMGTRHGDLHGANILVSSEEPSLEFTVIDPSAGLTSTSPFRSRASDFEWFKEHVAKALLVLQRHLPSISIQKHLGPRLFSIVNSIQRSDPMTFSEVLRLLESNSRYEQWLRERAEFIAAKFEQPKPLGLLRWEEIADPAQAVELFEPYPELFRRVRGFGNSLIVGARGSGKSTYLAALAYFPSAKKRLVEANEIFGVLFSCRQGEFKQFSKDFIRFDPASCVAVKHVLVLKIIRRLLAVLASATELKELHCSGDLKLFYDFIGFHMRDEGSIARVNTTPTAALSNLASGVVRWEELEVRRLFDSADVTNRMAQPHLDEAALLRFCELVRMVFSQLTTSQFYFLFDDAGDPNIPHEAQRVLNDLVTSSNAVYCIKLSAERFSYDLRDAAGRTLEETHDLTSFDIASAYASEAGIDQSRRAARQYFAQIMKKRLEHWHYPATDIAVYLGDQMKPGNEMIPIRELIRRLADSRKNAYYAGWEVVWQLADKTPRNLIELVSEIFAHARVRPVEAGTSGPPSPTNAIGPKIQDRAIRAVSGRRLRGLEFIPGEIDIRGRKVPLGKHLYLCTTSFGAVSHRYLTAHRKHESRRIDERLAVERNDTSLLRPEAQEVLQLLVRYGIFDDSGLNVAFDDGQKKPVYVFNRVFCPAFGISFRRDAHLRLSTRKLEMYLLEPANFAKRGTAFLRGESGGGQGEGRLWNEDKNTG